jgi:hypothetical protein
LILPGDVAIRGAAGEVMIYASAAAPKDHDQSGEPVAADPDSANRNGANIIPK